MPGYRKRQARRGGFIANSLRASNQHDAVVAPPANVG
jgi:hypothetical protein